ncbi:MAG: 3-dehydroquinate synthase, partial [Proteobacteria bacterium]|nr:3-dehydroquinate synthase [Pseudomonadota bacterium]
MTARGQRTAPPGQPAASLKVELGRRSYDILVGEGLLAAAGRHMLPVLDQPRTVIVTDGNVAPLYLAALEAALDEVDVEHTAIVLAAGERT